MSLVWIYQDNNYRRVDDLNPNQVLIMASGGCDGIKPLMNYVLGNVPSAQHGKVSAKVYRDLDDVLIHFLITMDNESKEIMIIVSKNPADTLFNYYTSSGENIVNCDFSNQ